MLKNEEHLNVDKNFGHQISLRENVGVQTIVNTFKSVMFHCARKKIYGTSQNLLTRGICYSSKSFIVQAPGNHSHKLKKGN